MPSRESFQQAINTETGAAAESGIVAGQFVVDRYWEKPLSETDASTWIYRLGLTVLDATVNGPRVALETFKSPPATITGQLPALATMYEVTEDALSRSTHYRHAKPPTIIGMLRDVRIQDPNVPVHHPHFGAMHIKRFRPTFVRTIPLPRVMSDVVGAFSTEFVERPDNGNSFPIRYSFLFQNNPISRPNILSGVTFNRRLDETWPFALSNHVNLGAVALWGQE